MPHNHQRGLSSEILRLPHGNVSPDLGDRIADAYNPERGRRDSKKSGNARGGPTVAPTRPLMTLPGLLPWRYATDTLFMVPLGRARCRSMHSMTFPRLAGFDRN